MSSGGKFETIGYGPAFEAEFLIDMALRSCWETWFEKMGLEASDARFKLIFQNLLIVASIGGDWQSIVQALQARRSKEHLIPLENYALWKPRLAGTFELVRVPEEDKKDDLPANERWNAPACEPGYTTLVSDSVGNPGQRAWVLRPLPATPEEFSALASAFTDYGAAQPEPTRRTLFLTPQISNPDREMTFYNTTHDELVIETPSGPSFIVRRGRIATLQLKPDGWVFKHVN